MHFMKLHRWNVFNNQFCIVFPAEEECDWLFGGDSPDGPPLTRPGVGAASVIVKKSLKDYVGLETVSFIFRLNTINWHVKPTCISHIIYFQK